MLTRYRDAAAFLQRMQARLAENEPANNLILGISRRLQSYPERIKDQPYFATVERGQQVVAAALMTPPHNLLVYAEETADAEAWDLVLADLIRDHWPVPGVLGPAPVASQVAAWWSDRQGVPYRVNRYERLYTLHVVNPQPDPGGALCLAAEEHVPLLSNWLYEFHRDLGMPISKELAFETATTKIIDHDMYLWVDGQPVTMVGQARPGVRGIVIAPVYTPPQFRRHGYASACTAAVSQRLLDAGWAFCSLFTDLANPISNSIYQKVGYRPVCDFTEYAFGVSGIRS